MDKNIKEIINELEERKSKIYKIDCDLYKEDPSPYITGCDYCKRLHGVVECPKHYADNLKDAIRILKKDYKVSKLIIKTEENLKELNEVSNR